MNVRRVLVVLGVVVGLGASAVPPLVAQTVGGELTTDHVRATAADFGAGTFGGRGLPTAAPPVESPYTWSRVTSGAHCVTFPGPVPPDVVTNVVPLPGIEQNPGSPVTVGSLQGAAPGAVWLEPGAPVPPTASWSAPFAVDTATRRDGGVGQLVVPRCVGRDDPGPLPDPPSAATLWQLTPLARARLEASPPGTREWPGIVNLESRFWSTPIPDAQATVTLDGYVVDVQAQPVAYAFTFGTGDVRVVGSPGSAAAPVGTTFRRRGDHEVTLHVVWHGVAHVLAPALGLDLGTHDLGTVTIGVATVHHVAEIRALLRSRTTER